MGVLFSSSANFSYHEQKISEIELQFQGVPVEKLDAIEPRLSSHPPLLYIPTSFEVILADDCT